MSKFRELELDKRASQYILEKLKRGNAFADLLKTRDDLVAGPVSTYLPFDPGVGPLHSFDRYIFPESKVTAAIPRNAWIPSPDSDPALVSFLQTFLAQAEAHMIVEEYLLNSDDLDSGRIETRTASFRDEVYHLLTHDDGHAEDSIWQTIRRARTWQFLGAMTSLPKEMLPFREATIAKETLEILAERATSLVIGAYDGEGFLISPRRTVDVLALDR